MKLLLILSLFNKPVEQITPISYFKYVQSSPNSLRLNEGEYIHYKKWLKWVQAKPLI